MRGVTILTRFAADRVAKRLRRYIAPLMSDAALDESRFDALLMGNGSGNLDRFVKRKSGSPRIISNIELPTLCETFPAAQGRTFSWLKERTAHCLAGRFCELGSGYIDLSDSTGGIRWLEDFKSGVTWPLTHYLRTEIVKGDSVSDIKTIWELSRFQIGPNLAQMELLTGDDIYRKRFIELVDDWQRKNPYPLGPNWNCSMEVALRAMNLLLALELFERRSPLPEPFLKAVYVALFQHGRHIRANPENTARGLNTNHYLANLIGLLTLGSFFEELPECAEWRDFAVEELAVEIDLQTTEDGFCYESSSAYHLLVLEFYLYALMFCRNNGIIL
ncbi:MAG: heparinase II/III family protein, partial [Candidatus Zixiibacteriota bacterium]